MHSVGKFLTGNPMRPPASVACTDTLVLRSPPILFPDLKHVGAFFQKRNSVYSVIPKPE